MQGVVEMANRDLIKRLDAIEQAIVGKHVELDFCPDTQLAHRVEKAIAKRHPAQDLSVCLPVDDADGEIEANSGRATHRKRRGSDALVGRPDSDGVRKWQRTVEILSR